MTQVQVTAMATGSSLDFGYGIKGMLIGRSENCYSQYCRSGLGCFLWWEDWLVGWRVQCGMPGSWKLSLGLQRRRCEKAGSVEPTQ